jgi:hypothetical protein
MQSFHEFIRKGNSRRNFKSAGQATATEECRTVLAASFTIVDIKQPWYISKLLARANIGGAKKRVCWAGTLCLGQQPFGTELIG